MAFEPPYSEPQGPESIKPNTLRAVSHQIEGYYDQRDEEPERSKEDEDFRILGMAPEDVPTLYKLPKEHAVYVIMCHNVEEDTIRDRANHFNVEVSDAMIHEYRRRWGTPYYVGYTTNPYRRMDEHFDQFKNGAKFTSIFPPRSLQVIKWYDDEDTAKKAEESTAKDIQRKAGGFLNPSVLEFPDQE